MSTDPQIREVLSYLKSEFPESVATVSNAVSGETKIRLTAAAQEHVLIIEQPFLEDFAAEEIKTKLSEFRLAATLRDVGEFPIIVSVNGCIFA
jgi:hypothetical protein